MFFRKIAVALLLGAVLSSAWICKPACAASECKSATMVTTASCTSYWYVCYYGPDCYWHTIGPMTYPTAQQLAQYCRAYGYPVVVQHS